VLVAANITMQFGAKPLFENVSVKFGEGNRYGLIGANGAGKSTFMKILCGVLESSAGNVSKDPTSAWPTCARISSLTKTCACSTW
jgi:ATPase subunit of ABC transporter with duplicated ATPase domains